MSVLRKFTSHPASVGETYPEHFVAAAGFAATLAKATFCCAVHAVFPFLFEKTGSRLITELHERMVTHRARAGRTGPGSGEGSVETTA